MSENPTLEAMKTYTERYRGTDGKMRAVLLWNHYEQLLAMVERSKVQRVGKSPIRKRIAK